jgi:DNA-binding FadR family transcriptional regulator
MSESRRATRTYSRRSLHGKVAHDLGARILNGDLAPGHVLPNEATLSAELKVSRTALREAIKVLAAKGLVESRPKTGTKVRPREFWNLLDPDILSWLYSSGPNREAAETLFELREIFEPQTAAMAAKRASPEQIKLIAQAFADMEKADGDVEAEIGRAHV